MKNKVPLTERKQQLHADQSESLIDPTAESAYTRQRAGVISFGQLPPSGASIAFPMNGRLRKPHKVVDRLTVDGRRVEGAAKHCHFRPMNEQALPRTGGRMVEILDAGPGARHKRYLVNAASRGEAIITLKKFLGRNPQINSVSPVSAIAFQKASGLGEVVPL